MGQVVTILIGITLLSPLAEAGIINPDVFTGTPENSWRYSELINAGKGQSTSYFPTNQSEYAAAAFRGYVTYDATQGTPPHGWTGPGFDSMQIFSTYVLSSVDQTVQLRFGGDDGKSLFVDDVFFDGGGFGVSTSIYNLALTAGAPRKLELAGYNGPGNWSFGIGLPGSGKNISLPIDSVQNVRMNADGDFASSPVPEPPTFTVFAIGVLLIAYCTFRGKHNRESKDAVS